MDKKDLNDIKIALALCISCVMFSLGIKINHNILIIYSIVLFGYGIILLTQNFSKSKIFFNLQKRLTHTTFLNINLNNITRYEARKIILYVWGLNLLILLIFHFIPRFLPVDYFSKKFIILLLTLFVIGLFIYLILDHLLEFIKLHLNEFKNTNLIFITGFVILWIFSIISFFIFPTNIPDFFYEFIYETEYLVFLLFVPFFNTYYIAIFLLSLIFLILTIKDFEYTIHDKNNN